MRFEAIDENDIFVGEYDDLEEAIDNCLDIFYFNESYDYINHLRVIDKETQEEQFNTKELYEQVYRQYQETFCQE